jgi:predicted lysophospholipase L1 biosynthesis ABC-type transport system permease subunit
VDYLNYLFDRNAYIVAAADNPKISDLQVLIPRVILLVRVDSKIAGNPQAASALQASLVRGFPSSPLEIHTLAQEVQKVGNDMFVSLALENMRIYLIGGLLLALIAILAIALANFTEDRRTLALIRIRGASPEHLRRFLIATLMSPALLGLVLGSITALIAGYGLTNYVWKLREIRSVVQLLKTHLVVSGLTFGIAILLIILIGAVAWLFSVWSFSSSAHERIREA